MPITIIKPVRNPNLKNILRVFRIADEIDLREGLVAFENYNRTMRRIATHYDYGMGQVVGAFCALSPSNDWEGNLRSLVSCIEGHRSGVPAERVTVTTYPAAKLRAFRCLNDEDFLKVTKAGKKTRSFYENICFPERDKVITIDGHMYCVWAGKRMTLKEVAWTHFDYDGVAKDFRKVAKMLGVRANQVQAVCWFAWKRIQNILYTPQLHLFRAGDQWGLLRDPEDIKPFPIKETSEDERQSDTFLRH
jgi:hypothetical protein